MEKILTFDEAKAECEALGDEAHYERKSRHINCNPAAAAIMDSFATVAQRAALAIAFMDAYDAATVRQVNAESFGLPAEVRA